MKKDIEKMCKEFDAEKMKHNRLKRQREADTIAIYDKIKQQHDEALQETLKMFRLMREIESLMFLRWMNKKV